MKKRRRLKKSIRTAIKMVVLGIIASVMMFVLLLGGLYINSCQMKARYSYMVSNNTSID